MSKIPYNCIHISNFPDIVYDEIVSGRRDYILYREIEVYSGIDISLDRVIYTKNIDGIISVNVPETFKKFNRRYIRSK